MCLNMSHSKAIERAILDLIEEWRDEFDTGPKQINSGSCAIFAMDVAEECPSAMLVKTGNEKVSGLVSLNEVDDPAHVWVTDGEYHYDAEVPTGVNDWKELPVFQRTLE